MSSLASSQPRRKQSESRLRQRRVVHRHNFQPQELQRRLHAGHQRPLNCRTRQRGNHVQGPVHGTLGDVAP